MNTVEQDQKRHEMWVKLFGEYYRLASKTEKKKMKLQYAAMCGDDVMPRDILPNDTYPYFNCCIPAGDIPVQTQASKTKEQNMRYDATTVNINANETPSTEKRQRDYLKGQLTLADSTQYMKLRKDFYLNDDRSPENFEQLLERITAGKFEIDEKAKKRETYGNPLMYVRWRDPAHPADEEGFEKAMEGRNTALTKAHRTIQIQDPKEGLAALEAFEASIFH